MIVVTGAAGFIGSCMVSYLNKIGYENLVLVDEFEDKEKELNLVGKKYSFLIEREEFFEWLNKNPVISFIFHMGARSDTTESDYKVLQHLNLEYSQKIWMYCLHNKVPLVYASSASTYGKGEFGFNDNHEVTEKLQPLNMYGVSKNEFDKWVLKQKDCPPFWGLKFFNVYGPNEYHKGRMASVVYHFFNQVKKNKEIRLFKSHREGCKDGEQMRDFIYVKDVIAVCYWLMVNQPAYGIYNLGTGKARTFNDLAKVICDRIEYIDIPEDIREKYQYFTEANMDKLKSVGYTREFYSLERGVNDYVNNYLEKNIFY